MNFEQFKIVIEALEKARERSHAICMLGVELLDYDEAYHITIQTLIEAVFHKEGVDWIEWFLYERPGFGDTPLKATDADGSEICHNIESLWETVKPHRKQ